MRNILITLLFVCLISSCEEQEIVDYSYKIGSIYCSDGKIYPYEVYLSEGKNNAVGIVCSIPTEGENEFKAFAVAMEDITDNSYATASQNIKGADGENGSANTAALLTAALNNEYEVPAATACTEYSYQNVRGWHLGSINELKDVHHHIGIINQRLTEVGGQQILNKWFLSSNQDNLSEDTGIYYCLSINLVGGSINNVLKSEKLGIRPLIGVR